ncbi:hypothetical protein [Streptomyces ipomoeae]|uniref:hypothetical protein n=1 Tax=Streptomyces ipomoeae TaxID=103232 RepID=UPI0029B1AE65|nr:hypothetical protein [Streptomyces ipomoeae]MDX2697014.1 hypothetical protein [Streptomyces ipomoeae]
MSVNVHAILVGLLSVGHTPEQADHAARSVLEQHAHELAKQQRALADANDELDHDHHVYGFSEAVRQAADLIDPKARRASTEGDTL